MSETLLGIDAYPLDASGEYDDGDNSELASTVEYEPQPQPEPLALHPAMFAAAAPAATVSHPVLPKAMPRTVKQGMAGRDVVAAKRALRKWQESSIGNVTRYAGPGFTTAVKKFQHAHGIDESGVLGPATYAKLAPFFDAYGAWLMGWRKTQPARERVSQAAIALYNYERRSGHVDYTQSAARMMIVRQRIMPADYDTERIEEDCSSSSTGWYWQAKCADPNGRGYDGQGFTGTLWPRGVRVAAALPGDLCFYGWDHARGCPTHVAVAVGDDPWKTATRIVSHGSQGGPRLESIHYRSDLTGIRSYLPRHA